MFNYKKLQVLLLLSLQCLFVVNVEAQDKIFIQKLSQARRAALKPHNPDCTYRAARYQHGEQVKTAEPCLNCTCRRGVLLCFLRVCPTLSPTPLDQQCETTKDPGECCPTVMCELSTTPPTTTTVIAETTTEIPTTQPATNFPSAATTLSPLMLSQLNITGGSISILETTTDFIVFTSTTGTAEPTFPSNTERSLASNGNSNSNSNVPLANESDLSGGGGSDDDDEVAEVFAANNQLYGAGGGPPSPLVAEGRDEPLPTPEELSLTVDNVLVDTQPPAALSSAEYGTEYVTSTELGPSTGLPRAVAVFSPTAEAATVITTTGDWATSLSPSTTTPTTTTTSTTITGAGAPVSAGTYASLSGGPIPESAVTDKELSAANNNHNANDLSVSGKTDEDETKTIATQSTSGPSGHGATSTISTSSSSSSSSSSSFLPLSTSSSPSQDPSWPVYNHHHDHEALPSSTSPPVERVVATTDLPAPSSFFSSTSRPGASSTGSSSISAAVASTPSTTTAAVTLVSTKVTINTLTEGNKNVLVANESDNLSGGAAAAGGGGGGDGGADEGVKILPNQLYATWKSPDNDTEERDRVDEILEGIIHALDKRLHSELPAEPRTPAEEGLRETDEPGPPPPPAPAWVVPHPQVVATVPLGHGQQTPPGPPTVNARRKPTMRRDDLDDHHHDQHYFQLPPIATGYITNLNQAAAAAAAAAAGNRRPFEAKPPSPPPPPPPGNMPHHHSHHNTVGKVQVSSVIGFNNGSPLLKKANSGTFMVADDGEHTYRKGSVFDDNAGGVEIITAKTPFLEAKVGDADSFLINLSPPSLKVGSGPSSMYGGSGGGGGGGGGNNGLQGPVHPQHYHQALGPPPPSAVQASGSNPWNTPSGPAPNNNHHHHHHPSRIPMNNKPPLTNYPTYFHHSNQWKIVSQNSSPRPVSPHSGSSGGGGGGGGGGGHIPGHGPQSNYQPGHQSVPRPTTKPAVGGSPLYYSGYSGHLGGGGGGGGSVDLTRRSGLAPLGVPTAPPNLNFFHSMDSGPGASSFYAGPKGNGAGRVPGFPAVPSHVHGLQSHYPPFPVDPNRPPVPNTNPSSGPSNSISVPSNGNLMPSNGNGDSFNGLRTPNLVHFPQSNNVMPDRRTSEHQVPNTHQLPNNPVPPRSDSISPLIPPRPQPPPGLMAGPMPPPGSKVIPIWRRVSTRLPIPTNSMPFATRPAMSVMPVTTTRPRPIVTTIWPVSSTTTTTRPTTRPTAPSTTTTRLTTPSTPVTSPPTTTTTTTPEPTPAPSGQNPWDLLRVSGCNIYGTFYKVDETITELSSACKKCFCSSFGVQCSKLC